MAVSVRKRYFYWINLCSFEQLNCILTVFSFFRASENNMQAISSQIEDLYLSNSRADVSDSLVQLMSSACIAPVLTPDRLSMELMMLVAILHGNVGSEVGESKL